MTDATTLTGTLTARARAVLACGDATEKAALAAALGRDAAAGAVPEIGVAGAPDRPARPARPELRAPRDMPRRRAGELAAGRVALLHALAHIELNAIDLACDIVARFARAEEIWRFAEPDLPRTFCDDWIVVAAEEAKHFLGLAARLNDFGAGYGDLPAHDGLWEAAEKTADDLLARLAVVPLVLEARGLDVTPVMIERMTRFGDDQTAALLTTIYRDEIGHVATGRKWFGRIAEVRGREPRAAWQELVAARFRGALKPPFNEAAREEAGFGADWYGALPEKK